MMISCMPASRQADCNPSILPPDADVCHEGDAATSEDRCIADELNLDRQKMFDVVSTSSGQCWSLNTYCPAPGIGPESPSDNQFKPGFSASLMLKDLTLAQKAAESKKVFTPLGCSAQQLYLEFVANGGAETDFSGIINFIKNNNRSKL